MRIYVNQQDIDKAVRGAAAHNPIANVLKRYFKDQNVIPIVLDNIVTLSHLGGFYLTQKGQCFLKDFNSGKNVKGTHIWIQKMPKFLK